MGNGEDSRLKLTRRHLLKATAGTAAVLMSWDFLNEPASAVAQVIVDYAPGTFGWPVLGTTDQSGAATFYSALFGWAITPLVQQGGVVYDQATIDGQLVAVITPELSQELNARVPPHWNAGIVVTDSNLSDERASELGATVLAPTYDFLGSQLTVFNDPWGALFTLWQPMANPPGQLVNVPGAMSWAELDSPSADLKSAAKFYDFLCDWTTVQLEGEDIPFLTITSPQGTALGAMGPTVWPKKPPRWVVYFGSVNIHNDILKAHKLGGQTVAKPKVVGPFKFALLKDPQGAIFGLYAL